MFFKSSYSPRSICVTFTPDSLVGGGDRGAGDREKRGREVYGRREKRGREAGFPRWREAGEKGEELRNIAQYFAIEKKQRGGSQKIQGGNRDYRVREAGGSNPPVPPPPLTTEAFPEQILSRCFHSFGLCFLNTKST